MGSPNTFNSNQIAEKWYAFWLANHYFHSEPDSRKPYTIVIPPPNVTGVLHMGHMMNNTLQDVLIRRARMLGMNACWVPGTDHASIATEAKVVQKLADQGVKKEDLTREEFLNHAWEWTDEHGGIILEQLKKLGCSCDWDRTKFTLDEPMTESVLRVFVDLFERGLIYRGFRMVNWDPEAQTTLSDEEVVYEEKQGNLYHIAYRVVDSEEMVIIANRADVDEELDRLEAHISEIRRVLTNKDSIGRRLDFLMQELNREANTLGSKSIAGVTTQASVELKVLIEQMREQIQNIE